MLRMYRKRDYDAVSIYLCVFINHEVESIVTKRGTQTLKPEGDDDTSKFWTLEINFVSTFGYSLIPGRRLIILNDMKK